MTDPITDPFKTQDEPNYLEELVGPGKKFATVEDLAKGKWHADTMVETLKAEKTALEVQAANGMNVDKLIEAINKGKTGTEGGQPPEQNQSNPPPQNVNIEELVLNTLKKTEADRKIETNKQAVVARMNEVWGADASKELRKTAAEIGVSVDYLNGVAQQSPEAFYKLVSLNQNRNSPSGTTVPQGTVRLEGNGTGQRDAKFYRELKKNNPSLYKETKIQVQMSRDALALGEAFFN